MATAQPRGPEQGFLGKPRIRFRLVAETVPLSPMEDVQHVLAVAREFVDRFGPAEAVDEAEQRTKLHADASENDGASFWRRVRLAIRSLQYGDLA
ncbi:MAG: hypothetical protein HYR63_10870 [Proteobacteria bacterium]|nr:hypothetical protein [Pseudomonadota bacterium]MBI3498275.1 hypothetical protein [Pseudomonadota bacterium]